MRIREVTTYLVGNAWFKRLSAPHIPLSHLVGLAMFGALAGLAWADVLSPLALALIANGVLLVVAVWESLAIRRGARSPVEA